MYMYMYMYTRYRSTYLYHTQSFTINSPVKFTCFLFRMGGVVPNIAESLHRRNIDPVVTSALEKAGISLSDVDAIATTVKPGNPRCIKVGFEYAKTLLQKSR